MSGIESLKIRPYARLITMLGDQLIKDESIALIELVKNAYDADAKHVKISFVDFNDNYTAKNTSAIIIEDDGNGMNDVILKQAWMNPATPEKLKRKKIRKVTDSGRIMQGEKGIGRFAIFKLGRKIDIITRRQKQENTHFIDLPESENEYCLRYDFSDYDSDFLKKKNEEKEIFLEDLSVVLEERNAVEIVPSPVLYGGVMELRKPYGTKIVISNLSGAWNQGKIEKVRQNITRLQPIFGDEFVQDFAVYIEVNGGLFLSKGKSKDEIKNLIEQKSVFKVSGSFNADDSLIEYEIKSKDEKKKFSFHLTDPEMMGILPLKDYLSSLQNRKVECGPFRFEFYIFDLAISVNSGDTRYYLDKDEKESIKSHRVYLYRDGIRVLPYGDPEDDWLKLDMIRGVESAGRIFGNDQLIGYIAITQKDNPLLKDKTNREGLIEEGYAKEDLINICQLILRYIRAKNYAKYLIDKKSRGYNKKDTKPSITIISDARKEKIGEKAINSVLSGIENVKVADIPSEKIEEGNQYIDSFLANLEETYKKEKDVLDSRIAVTENLAAIGLSAETAYHDARIILQEANNKLSELLNMYIQQKSDYLDRQEVIKSLKLIKTQTSTAASLMLDIQRLFPSTKSRKKQINVRHTLITVKNLYAKSLLSANINCVIKSSDQDLLMVCTDAVLLQVFINLFDNALYWLKTVPQKRMIVIQINSSERTVIFADSGAGVRQDDIPYIFEPFFSGKGQDGKGLGLYIARQLLSRYNSSIELVTDREYKILNGANFILKLGDEES